MKFGVYLGALCFLAYGCKSARKSDQKSLDALAGQSTANVCKAAPAADFSERYETFWEQGSIKAGKGPYQENLKEIFAAVPLEFQSWYFLKGGKVEVIGKASDFCEQISGSTKIFANDGTVGGCISFPKEGEFVGMPTIYVGVDGSTYEKQMEQASLIVQGFGVVLSSFMTEVALAEKLSSDNELVYEYGAYDVEMRNLKSSLAFIVTEDLMNHNGEDGKPLVEGLPDVYRNKLAEFKISDAKLDRNSRWANMWNAFNDADVREYINFTLSQVIDSAWCNDNTRAGLKEGVFIETGRYYRKDVAPVFAEVFSKVTESESDSSTSLAGDTESTIEASEEIMGPTPTGDDVQGFQLGQRLFPVLGAVVRAPFAVAGYFRENKPVRTWFATHKPVRRVLFGAGQAVARVARGVATGTRKVVGGVARGIGNGINRVGYRVRNGCLIRRWRC